MGSLTNWDVAALAIGACLALGLVGQLVYNLRYPGGR